MPEWITINLSELNKPQKDVIKGMDVKVYFSPYDMPRAVCGEYGDDKSYFAVKLAYFDKGEKTVSQKFDDKLEFLIGKSSGRLHEVRLDMNKLTVQAKGIGDLQQMAFQEIDDAVKSFAEKQSGSGSLPIDNYIAASGAIEQRRDLLFKDLVSTP